MDTAVIKPAGTIQTQKTENLVTDMTHISGVVTSIAAGHPLQVSN
jgi:hypothetical protein